MINQHYLDVAHCLPNSSVCRYAMCECPDAKYQQQCNQQQFTIGLFYINTRSNARGVELESGLFSNPLFQLGLKMQKLIIDDPVNGDVAQNRLASDVLSYTMSISQNRVRANEPITSFNDPVLGFVDNSWANGKSFNTLLADAYSELCGDVECAAYVFKTNLEAEGYLNRYRTSFSDLFYNSAASNSLSCRNVLPREGALDNFARNAPTPLVHDYYQCSKTLTASLASSLGNAVASANFYSSLVWIVAGYLIVFVLKARHKVGGLNIMTARGKETTLKALRDLKDESVLDALRALQAENRDLRLKVEALEGIKAAPLESLPRTDIIDEKLQRLERLCRTEQSPEDWENAGKDLSMALHKRLRGQFVVCDPIPADVADSALPPPPPSRRATFNAALGALTANGAVLSGRRVEMPKSQSPVQETAAV